MEPRRCVAPLDDAGERLCGEMATTDRDLAGAICPLCNEHAAEIDSETETNQPKGTN